MSGSVGKDNFGDFLHDNLNSNHVNTKLIHRDDASTGIAINVMDANKQISIVPSTGANSEVKIGE